MLQYLLLIRLHKPFGFLLLFASGLLGILVGSFTMGIMPNILLILKFLIGAIFARGGGCIINDIFDAKIDAKVERTKNRPIASGKITKKNALIFAFFIFFASFLILLSLPTKAILSTFLAMILVLIYPIFKRFSNFPQVVLGLAYSSAFIVGYFSVNQISHYSILFIYASLVLWVIIFDTIYAKQDENCDAKIGVKSTALKFGKNYKKILQFLAIFYLIFLLIFWNIWSMKFTIIPFFSYVLLSFIVSKSHSNYEVWFKAAFYPCLILSLGFFINIIKIILL